MIAPGKLLFVVGRAIAVAGLLLWSGMGRSWPGRLPGDINIVQPNYSFHFPIVTCLPASLLIPAILWRLRRWSEGSCECLT